MRKRRRCRWGLEAVSSIADVNPTTSLPEDDGSVPYYEMAAIDESTGELREPEMVSMASGRSGKTKFRNADVLFAKITPCVQNGKSALARGVPGDLAFGSSEFYVLRARKKVLPEFLYFFVRQRKVVGAAVASFSGTSGRQRVPRTFWDALEIPTPPLTIQERIVHILQKADEIRRKRQDAMDVADAILPATFISMFGDPGTNPKKLPRRKLSNLCHPTSGGTPSKKNAEFWSSGTIPWVSPEDMKVPEIYDVPDKITEAALGHRAKALNGTVLIVVRGMILQHSAPVGLVRAPLTFNQDIKGLVPIDGVPGEFLFWILRCSKERLLRLVTTASHGTKKIDTDQLLDLDLFLPPASEMTWFASVHRQFFEAQDKRLGALDDAQATFASLLSQAFNGELTAEWEKINAKEIEARTAFNERLPRLLVLAFLAEKAKRVGRHATEMLVTALMKYAFLFQMEANGRRRLYHFVPYHYGPFAKELYADLEKLQADGLVSVDNDSEEDKTRITLTDPAKADEALAEVPDDLKEDVATILDSFGDLNHKNLLKTVYDKYPAYAKKSRLRKTAAKKAGKNAPRRRTRKS